MKIKLCGFTEKETLEVAVKQQCDFVGFVFCKSSVRYISPKDAKDISNIVPKNIAKVAVVVDASLDFLKEIIAEVAPDFIQFHGSENIEFLKDFKINFPEIGIIKAFRVESELDIKQAKFFEDAADYILFDSKSAGSGNSFDWSILKNYHSRKDWLLSGGININNIDEALRVTGARMVDISSGIEEMRGKKSPDLIEHLMTKIRTIKINN